MPAPANDGCVECAVAASLLGPAADWRGAGLLAAALPLAMGSGDEEPSCSDDMAARRSAAASSD
jgi:hypothetical protein